MSLVPAGAVPAFQTLRISRTSSEAEYDPKQFGKSIKKQHCCSRGKEEEERGVDIVHLRTFTEQDALSNVVLEVDGTDLHVHREILGEWSPVFKVMFTSSFVETEQKRVRLPDKQLEDVLLLLNCLYPLCQMTVNKENVMRLLSLVDEYDISFLKQKCEQVLMTFDCDMEIVFIAHNYNMLQLLQQSMERCALLPLSSIDHHSNNELVQHIPDSIKLDIYREKITQQAELLKVARKEREQNLLKQSRVQKWGTEKNSYPCEKHRSINDECLHCLKAFRQFVQEQLK